MKLNEIKRELEKMMLGFAKKVAPVYQIVEWEWSPLGTAPHIPSVGEIESTLYDLIEGLTEECLGSATGGLEAYYSHPNEHESGHYGLTFTLRAQRDFD